MDAQNYLEHDKKSTTNNDHQENLQQDKLLSTSVNDKHRLSAAPIANNHLNNNNNHTITAREGPKPKTTGHDMIEAKNVPAKVDNLQTTAQVNNCEPIEDNSSSGNIDNNHSGPLDDECQLSAEIERLEQEVKETHQSMIERNAPSTLSPPEDYENLNSGNQLVQLCDEQAGKTKRSIDHEPKVNKKTPAVEVAAPPEPALQPVQSETATIIASMDTNSNNSDSPAISQENSPREQQDNDHPKTTPNFSPESPPNTANSSPFHLSQTQVDQASGATTSTKIIDNNTNIAGDQEKVPDEEVGSALGRNRRVRQKNRYFLDFHCIDLVKGCRSKDDYDAYPSTGAGSATRSSNRRSTTDSSRSGLQEDEPDVFIDRYCRKCSNKTPHDFEDGCQVCLYKQIVLTNKRQKTGSQRSRSSRSQSQRQDTKNNNNEPAATTITTSGSSTTTTNSVSKSSNSRSKRKATKQAGGPSKQSNSIDLEPDISLKRYTDIIDGLELATNTAIVSTGPKGVLAGDDNDDKYSSNNNDAASAQVSNKVGKLTATIKVDGNASKSKWVIKPGRSQNDENVISIRREVEHDIKHQEQQQNHHHSYPAEDKSSTTTNQDDEMIHTNNNNNNDNNNKSTNACDIKAINNLNSNKSNINNNNNDNNNSQMSGLELTHLDTWTPDQVAQYVSSKGFVSEAESFRAEAVDGISLLLMQRTDFTYGLKMKLGPALKLYDQVCKLKRDYFRDIATAS